MSPESTQIPPDSVTKSLINPVIKAEVDKLLTGDMDDVINNPNAPKRVKSTYDPSTASKPCSTSKKADSSSIDGKLAAAEKRKVERVTGFSDFRHKFSRQILPNLVAKSLNLVTL